MHSAGGVDSRLRGNDAGMTGGWRINRERLNSRVPGPYYIGVASPTRGRLPEGVPVARARYGPGSGHATAARGLRVPAVGATPRCPVSLSGTPRPKVPCGAAGRRLTVHTGCGVFRPAPLVPIPSSGAPLRGHDAFHDDASDVIPECAPAHIRYPATIQFALGPRYFADAKSRDDR